MILLWGGLCVLVAGFLYDVKFAGIPYQDPTPEMSASYGRHSLIASTLCFIGAGAFLAGCFACIFRCGIRRLRRSSVN
jgi:hypothetical protein